MKPTAELVNELLERERRAQGLTWKELAEAFHVNTATLWKWRRGRALGSAANVLVPLAIKYCADIASSEPSS